MKKDRWMPEITWVEPEVKEMNNLNRKVAEIIFLDKDRIAENNMFGFPSLVYEVNWNLRLN